ncbi:MAG: alpha/beta hydrolase [Alysiella sp.]|uniref:YheT family hydrolase n=1 Tax=Alysiella sp. TaxID=1872483 RepID=UPI0026DB8224|nr:alpha/beta fold hydrolase [Alysiella sp.]MDO4433246.1 alpha/beta hydrolase [Alysiella sp.]
MFQPDFSRFYYNEPQVPLWLWSGNAQTLYAKTLQRPAPPYRRELLLDSYGEDQVAYDFVDAADVHAPCVVLFHGLEGSSHSHYATELMHAVRKFGWHGVVAHFRSCGGVPSKRMYHSGDTREIAHTLNLLSQRYPNVYAVGVSLGGNALMKYLGEQGNNAVPRAAAAVSAPVNLPASGHALIHGLPKLLYTEYFLKTLMNKVPHTPTQKIRHLGDFDDAYTAPMHGFANKDDYYRRAAALPFLKHIATPTLLLNARNDPFLPAPYLPTLADVSPYVYLLQPQHGGHVAFVSGTGRGHLRWLPETLFNFFTAIT